MKALKNENSYSWFLAYFILLICFILSVVMIFLFNKQVSKETNEKYCNMLFNEISQNATDAFACSNQMYSMLVNYDYIDEILKIDDINDYYKSDALFDLIDRLYTAKRDTDFYIYFPKSNTVVTKTGILTSEIYFDNFVSKYDVEYKEWMEQLHGERSGATLSVRHIDDSDMFLSEKYVTTNKQSLYLVTKLSEESIFGAEILSGWTEDVDIYISDLSGNLYISSSERHLTERTLDAESIGKSYGDDWEIFERMEYSVLPMKIMIAYPENIAPAEISVYNKLQVWLCIVLIVLNAGLIIHILMRDHKSIKTIMKLFGVKHARKGLKGIEENIDAILKKNSDYSNQIKKTTFDKENLILEKCLCGVYQKSKIGKTLKEAGIEFNYKYFALCAFKVEELENFYGDNSGNLSLKEKFDDLTFVFQNVLAELFLPHECYIRITPVEKRIIAIINMDDEIHYNCHTVNDVLHQGTEFINRNFFIKCTFVTTELFSDIGHLADNYAQAVHLLRYKDIMGIDGDLELNVSSVNSEAYFEAFLNCDTEQKLINYITASDFESAKFLIEHIFSELSAKRMSFEQRQCVMIDIGCMLCKIPHKEVEFDFAEILSNSVNVNEMKEYLCKIVERMCRSVTVSDLKREKLMVVKNYIDTRYYEGLDLNLLSNIFKISQNYLSASFRKEFDVSIPEYINKVRIKNAKQLFKNSDKSVKEVAERVGFTNVSTFDRIFKKYEGITPTAFKNNIR